MNALDELLVKVELDNVDDGSLDCRDITRLVATVRELRAGLEYIASIAYVDPPPMYELGRARLILSDVERHAKEATNV